MAKSPILFDLDGTLVDSLADIASSTNFVRDRLGLPPLSLTAVRNKIGDGVRKLLERALDGLERVDLDLAVAEFQHHHTEQCTVQVQPMPGVIPCLRSWQQAGHRMAVVTNKPEAFAHRIITHLRLDRYLSVVVGGDSTPRRKPAAEPLLEALRQLDSTVPATIVGDGVQDLRAGKAAGIRTIAFLAGFGDPDELRAEGADRYWQRFETTLDPDQ